VGASSTRTLARRTKISATTAIARSGPAAVGTADGEKQPKDQKICAPNIATIVSRSAATATPDEVLACAQRFSRASTAAAACC